MDVLADYMGHDLHIHRQFYRLPNATHQVAENFKVTPGHGREGRRSSSGDRPGHNH